MACVQEIHIGDIGTVFEITITDCTAAVDISTATDMSIVFRKPDGAIVEKTAEFLTDGTDGKLAYTTVDGDIDQKGTWKIQAKVVMPSGAWSSNIDSFKVYENL
jgi:hypothetical protein